MKFISAAALVIATNASSVTQETAGFLKSGDAVTNKLIWGNDWNKYKASRPQEVDCSVREAENWLGSRMCKYSWECVGARTCEGSGWCTGNDACDEIEGFSHYFKK